MNEEGHEVREMRSKSEKEKEGKNATHSTFMHLKRQGTRVASKILFVCYFYYSRRVSPLFWQERKCTRSNPYKAC